MSRFFFNMREGDCLVKDPDGSELPNVEAAKEEARISARHLLAEKLRAGEVIDGQCFEITDEAGELRAVIRMKDVLRLE